MIDFWFESKVKGVFFYIYIYLRVKIKLMEYETKMVKVVPWIIKKLFWHCKVNCDIKMFWSCKSSNSFKKKNKL